MVTEGIDSKILPSYLKGEAIPTDLYFDNDSKFSPDICRLSHANALQAWQQGEIHTEECARALASYLIKHKDKITDISDVDSLVTCLEVSLQKVQSCDDRDQLKEAIYLLILAELKHLSKDNNEAEALFRKALIVRKQIYGEDHPEVGMAIDYLASFLERIGKLDEALEVRRSNEISSLIRSEYRYNLAILRYIALDLYVKGRFADAEPIYQHLVARGYELASTHCHTARLRLMEGKYLEASQEIDKAWDNRAYAKSYVIPRIHYLRLMVNMINKEEYKHLLLSIFHALREKYSTLVWTIEPVLEQVKPQLLTSQYVLLNLLVPVLNGIKSINSLNESEEWKAAFDGFVFLP